MFRHDPERGRGEPLGVGRKAGFCFADVGLVGLGLPHTEDARFHGTGCFVPSAEGDWYMGVTPNWYDLYPWVLAEQYVDISDAEDGLYELVSTANVDGTIIESDATDNEASVIIRLTGNTVEILRDGP